MLKSMQDRRALFFKMSKYLDGKAGPIRAERLPEHLGMGVAYFDLSTAATLLDGGGCRGWTVLSLFVS